MKRKKTTPPTTTATTNNSINKNKWRHERGKKNNRKKISESKRNIYRRSFENNKIYTKDFSISTKHFLVFVWVWYGMMYDACLHLAIVTFILHGNHHVSRANVTMGNKKYVPQKTNDQTVTASLWSKWWLLEMRMGMWMRWGCGMWNVKCEMWQANEDFCLHGVCDGRRGI